MEREKNVFSNAFLISKITTINFLKTPCIMLKIGECLLGIQKLITRANLQKSLDCGMNLENANNSAMTQETKSFEDFM